MKTHRSESAWVDLPPPPARWRTISCWIALVLGVVLAAVMTGQALMVQQGAVARARTAEGVVTDIRLVGSALSQLRQGNADDFDKLSVVLPRIRSGLTALGSGGRSDYLGGKAIAGAQGPWSGFQPKVAEWEKYLQDLRDSALLVRELAQADRTFRDTLQAMPATLAAVKAHPALAQPSWARVLEQSMLAFDGTLDSVRTLFSAQAHLRAEQRRWADQTAVSAASFQQVLAVANQDPNVPTKAREDLGELGRQLGVLAQTSALLESRFEFRVALERSEQFVGTEVMRVLPALDSARELTWKQTTLPAWGLWGAAAGMGLFVIGLLSLARIQWTSRRRHALLTQESRLGHALHEQMETGVRKLKTILDGNWIERLDEHPQEEIFTYNTMVNRLLDSKDGAMREIRTTLEHSQRGLLDFRKLVERVVMESGTVSSNISEIVKKRPDIQRLWIQVSNQQNDLAVQAESLQETGRMQGDVLKENNWRASRVNRNTQDIIRRLKKMGEVVQTVSQAVFTVRELGRKAQVLSTNIAVQAADSGESGRPFATFARQIQQVSQDIGELSKDLETSIADIQREAREAVAAMEQGVPEVEQMLAFQEDSGRKMAEILQKFESFAALSHHTRKLALDFTQSFTDQGNHWQAIGDRAQTTDSYWRQSQASVEKLMEMGELAYKACTTHAA